MPVINEVRAAASEYVNAVFEASGWGNVFADLHEEDDDEGWDEEDDDDFIVEDGVERISVTGRWDFLVRDAEALRAFAAERLRADSPNADDDDVAEHSDSPGAALESLVAMTLESFPGLEGAGGGWNVGPVAKTLFEMSPDERDEAGF